MLTSVYVYYRVRTERVTQARHAVMRLFEELYIRSSVQGRLLRRHHDPLMWLEIYQPVSDIERFERELREVTLQIGFSETIVAEGSARVSEVFIEDVLTPHAGRDFACA